MRLDLQYFHVIVFLFLISYLDAYLFIIIFFLFADNEHDDDELEEAAEELNYDILRLLMKMKAIDLKGATFTREQYMENDLEFLGGI